MIVIIDYGLGNLASIQNMLKHIGVKAQITSEAKQISDAQKIILPGVGKFDTGMQEIARLKIRDILEQKVIEEKTPILGICLGMQLLTKGSEEGTLPGLGWIDAETKRFSLDSSYKIPHMGWNEVNATESNILVKNTNEFHKFYFAHSYYVETLRKEESILWTNYGIRFASGICKDNIYGVQFHPEKSHKFGMNLIKNFIKLGR